MQALLTRQEMESWQRCDEEPSQNPRQAVSEWLGRGLSLDSRKKVDLQNAYGQVKRGGKLDFIHRFAQKKVARRSCDLTDLWNEIEGKMVLRELKPTNLIALRPVEYVSVDTSQIVQEFNERAERWRRDTSFQSSLVAQFMHEDYQSIMAKGIEVIPLILGRLQKAPEKLVLGT